ncbi:Uncharacterized membrane protein YcaP, DUF421 family [Pelagirhabdus alkalitolerans]|uniref:Uncharacterized membrane protein YcaP, DUF421 family n=2 Tax=Pelagirhabdus alkalitolerans TaxID=1612202 RepID=A0A1G6GRP8_9BACI|nr:DUF421 domain-containing protein [Pelagirhabdus alkalitolerans]SDB84405.1 Uncharacterized membrane protein YcaP, DUF421 family [Pelagirhabdus alkalitolerans]
MEFITEILLILGRIVSILPLLLLITIFMGKRAIGELPVFDFLIIVVLGAVVGADIADPEIDHLPTAITIVAIGIIQRVVANWKISNRRIAKRITFEPTVVIQNGQLIHQNLKAIRFSIDNILQMLREKDVFDISEVETAIVEANGALSVLKKPDKAPITLEDMNIKKTTSISFPVILDGNIDSTVLKKLELNEAWLQKQLTNQEIHDINTVFFASVNHQHELHVSLKDECDVTIPPLKH